MALTDTDLRVDFEGESFAIPLKLIAYSRAEHYADEYGDNVSKSLGEDTIPLFEADPGEAIDWAASNMNWSDVAKYAIRIPLDAKPVDREAEWSNADKSIAGPEVLP